MKFNPIIPDEQSLRRQFSLLLSARDIIPPEDFPEALRRLRVAAREVYRKPVNDPLRLPLSGEWRHVYRNECGESGADFRILPECPEDPYTDDEILDYIQTQPFCYGEIRSPYDCTGRRFTSGLYWKRTPAGIVLIHYWALDI